MAERDRDRKVGPSRGPRQVVPGLAASQQDVERSGLLTLQRTAGNSAILNAFGDALAGRALRNDVGGRWLVVQRVGTRIDFQDALVHPHPQVTNVYFGDRPPANVTGGDGQGAHTTAYDVFEWAITLAVQGQTFANAVTRLRTLVQGLGGLPGFDMGYQVAVDYRRGIWTQLLNDCAAIVANPAIVDPLNRSQRLGDLSDRYLTLRNGIPLTAWPTTPGGPTGAVVRAGSTALAGFAPAHPLVLPDNLLAAADLATARAAIWNVFDYRPTTGIHKDPHFAARVVAQLLLSVFQSYPTLLSHWHGQIRDAIVQQFLLTRGAGWGWSGTHQEDFREDVEART